MNSHKIAVLIPAHNEGLTIEKTLTTLLPQLTESDGRSLSRIIVQIIPLKLLVNLMLRF